MFKSTYGHVPIPAHVQQIKPHTLDAAAKTKAKQQADVRDIVRTKLQRRIGGVASESIKGTSV